MWAWKALAEVAVVAVPTAAAVELELTVFTALEVASAVGLAAVVLRTGPAGPARRNADTPARHAIVALVLEAQAHP